MRRSGSWPSVCAHPDGWAGAYLSGGQLITLVNGAEVWRADVGDCRYTDIACVGDVIHAVMTREAPDKKDYALFMVGDQPASLGQCYGMRPIALQVWDGDLIACMVLPGPTKEQNGTRYRRFNLTTGGHTDHDTGYPDGTVFGIFQMVDGQPVLTPPRVEADGFVLEHAQKLDDETFIGQSEEDRHGVLVAWGGGVGTIFDGAGREPKGVRLDDGRYVFCARVGNEACFEVCPLWPAVLTNPADEDVPIVRVPKLNRPFAFGPWFATSDDASVLAIEPSGHRDHSGNLEIPINATQAQVGLVKTPMVAPINLFPLIADDKLYAGLIHIDGDTSDERIREAIPFYRESATARGVGLWVYDDRVGSGYRLDVIRPLLKPGDVAVPCWNPVSADEIGPTLRLRLGRELTRLKDAGLTVAPSLCAYSMNGRLTRANLARLWQLYVDLIFDRQADLFGAGYFALLRQDGVSKSGHEFLADLIDEFADGITERPARPTLAAPDHGEEQPAGTGSTHPTPPIHSPLPEDPMSTQKTVKVALRRDFDTKRFLSVGDDRASIDARLTDMSDPRTHFEVHIFDQPGHPAGKWDVGNKVILRSAQDQSCVNVTPDGKKLGANLSNASMFEIRKGEFDNTWALLVPVIEQGVTFSDQGKVTVGGFPAPIRSLHDVRLFNVDTKQEIVGPF